MKGFNKMTAYGAVVALAAVGSLAFAQDDLDDLLKDLEGNAPVEEAKPAGESPTAAAAEEVKTAVEEKVEAVEAAVEEVTVEEESEVDTKKSGKSKLQTRADSK